MALITPERAVTLVGQLSKLSTEQLSAYLDTASNAIEAACGRKFASSVVVNEVIRTDVYGRVWLERTPVVPGTLVLTDLEETPIDRWRLDTDSGELEAPRFRDALLLASYTGGFVMLPKELELAVATLARYRSDRDQSVSSGEITSKEIGNVKIAYGQAVASSASIPQSILDGIAHLMMPRLV
jgi:hypothetical protein